MKHLLLYAFLSICIISCKAPASSESAETTDSTKTEITRNFPIEFNNSLEAHGGYDNWNTMQSLSYTIEQDGKEDEKQIIDLTNRKTRIENTNWTVGFDGTEAWVSPNKETYGKGSPRFYHNLIFYFYAIPWVLADPGVNYKVLDVVEHHGKKLLPISCTFNDGVGDAPDDEYIIHIDTETQKVYLLLYTVTYTSRKKSDRYGALVFEEWVNKNGVDVPKILSWYKYEDGVLGEKRSQRLFKDITLSPEKHDQQIFEMPENAEIDSLK